MDESGNISDSEALRRVLSIIEPLSRDARLRVIRAILAFFGDSFDGQNNESVGNYRATQNEIKPPVSEPSTPSFSEDRSPSAKSFLFEKRPVTDVERVACLAYYLAHYLSIHDFKTLDISKLNTEAAQIKFSNPAQAVDNAMKAGFLIQSTRGQKRLSALGELYVQALPDRVAAREAIAHARSRRRKGRE